MDTLEPGNERLRLLQEGENRTGLLFPVSPPSPLVPCAQASFSRGCPIRRWKHLFRAVLIHRRERAPGLWPVLEGERLFQSALHSEQ